MLRVSEAVVAHSPGLRFVRAFRGLEVLPRAGELIATDGALEFRTRCDETVRVMPSPAPPQVGATRVRLGRCEDL
ncbi:MAG TPA: hypothetical protein PKB14_07075 [Rubrivivax sp.]|nr:hypothetical protein [Rubrivivax sp.]